MRVLTSFFLLCLLLLNLFGFFFIFSFQQNEIQEKVQASFHQSANHHLEILSFSKNDFEKIIWLKEGKEFRLNGKLYDVSRIETSNSTVKLFVEEDSMETKLVDNFVALFTSQNDKPINSSPIKIPLQHFMQEFTCNTLTIILHPSFYFVSLMEKKSSFSSITPIGQSPPPDKFFS